MPLTAADLVMFASASMPDDDTTTSGGAIDLKRRVAFTDAAGTTITVVSANAGDTQNCTITGRDASGAIKEETKQLQGQTPVVFSYTLDRILQVELASDAVGAITVSATGGGTLATIPAGERGFMRLFRNAESEDTPAARYEKVFIKNTDDTYDLLTAAVVESVDPQAIFSFTLASAKDDSNSVTNRKTAPGSGIIEPDTFDGTQKSVPTGELDAGEAIGVWIKQSLTATHAPFESYYTLQALGASS